MTTRSAAHRTSHTARRLAAVTAAVVLPLAGAAVPALAAPAAAQQAPAPATQSPSQPLQWGPCPAHVQTPSAVCATMQVPLDYSDPGGPMIDVMVEKQPAANPGARRGVVFGNAGGPGGDTLSFFDDNPVFTWPQELRNEFDLIAVQPRGLQHATPIDCGELPTDPFVLATNGGGAFAAGCEANSPGYARHITTENTARDWEMARQALGEERINIYGLSYGTQLGSVYATLFPQHTDKLVLDSGIDPDRQWGQLLRDQDPAYKQRFYDMFSWIADNDAEYHLGTTALQVYQRWSERVVAEVGVPPTVAPPPAQVGDVPPALSQFAQAYIDGTNLTNPARVQFEGLVAQLLTGGAMQLDSPALAAARGVTPQSSMWPDFARSLRDGLPFVPVDDAGNPVDLSDSQDPKAQENYRAMVTGQTMQSVMLCNENQSVPNPLDYPGFLWTNFVTGDLFDLVGLAANSGAMCLGWPPVTRAPMLDGSQLQTRPLQLQAQRDPQTPYGPAQVMRERMGSHLITVGGGDHGNFAKGNQVVDAAVLEYLRTGHTGVTEAPATPVFDAFA